ncbi:MAG: ATP-binding cassette domain-containing protein [Desulfovermiculus sp.]|nr:ATP-binding cassette domain-containing protein [Desulfovermiculus sp.]
MEKHFYLHEQKKHIPSATGVHLQVHPGQLTALIGPTGCGKSSVLKSIYRTYIPSRGLILYRSARDEVLDLALLDEHRIMELRKREIRFVTQFLQFVPRQQTLDVVAAPLYKLGYSREEGRARARRLLHRLGIPERLWTLPPSTFSGGERQRVNLAQGMISRPRLLLLDEPTASLNPKTRREVTRIIREIKSWGTGILAVLHDMELVDNLAEQTVGLDLPVIGESSEDQPVPFAVQACT